MVVTGRAGGRVRVPLALVVAGVLPLLALAGCGTPHPVCDHAEQLRQQGHLALAAEEFARASRVGEGDCAAEGSQKVAELQVKAMLAVARGWAAEDAGDARAAQAAYQEAQRTDKDNREAGAGLTRLAGSRTTPVSTTAPGAGATQIVVPPQQPASDIPWWVPAGLLALLVGGIAGAVLLRGQLAVRDTRHWALRDRLTELRNEHGVDTAALDERVTLAEDTAKHADSQAGELRATLREHERRVKASEEQNDQVWSEHGRLQARVEAELEALRARVDRVVARLVEGWPEPPSECGPSGDGPDLSG